MRGTGLILFLFLVIVCFHYSRWAFPEKENLPAVMRLKPQLATVAVADSDGSYRLYQFHDGGKLGDVIKLTNEFSAEEKKIEKIYAEPIFSGEVIKVIKIEGEYFRLERSWLPARHRILLRIPLHPDRMNAFDWETLPGIGPKLAIAIENDRQKNGDFNDFFALQRVKGVGVKKLEAWQEYFIEKSVLVKIEN
ncbi:MAG: helix-hairpin-helix domain-containing protein [Desulfuromonadales bacterium]|nr:helix-hairpin-helix domain-containing protein [Desulfuromonadales bacterium]